MDTKELWQRLANCISDHNQKRLDDGCTHEDMADIYEYAYEQADQVARDAIAALENAVSDKAE